MPWTDTMTGPYPRTQPEYKPVDPNGPKKTGTAAPKPPPSIPRRQKNTCGCWMGCGFMLVSAALAAFSIYLVAKYLL